MTGCTSIAVESSWEPYEETVCRGFFKKECKKVASVGWVPKTKVEMRGAGTLKAEFPSGTKGEKGLITFPDLKLQN